MIEYIEVRAANTREIIGIVDTAKSIIWHCCYYDVGDFEIYCPCTPENVALLEVGNYVTRPNDDNVGLIESLQVTYDAQNGRMLVVSGRMAKSILTRRIIYRISGTSVSPTILSGNVETAARSVVTANAISCPFDSARNISILELGAHSGTTDVIIDDEGNPTTKQVTYENLMSWTDEFLREYGIGSRVILSAAGKLQFVCFKGRDKSIDNLQGNEPVIFSQQFDNLISSNYQYNEADYKNAALIGGEGEGTARFCALYIPQQTGFERREIFIDASQTSQTYEDEHGDEQTLTDAEYIAQLQGIATQQLAESRITETFDGEVNVTNNVYKYGIDYSLGDIITIEDNEIGLYINTRIIEVTEVQDDNGYNISVVYGNE